MAEIGGSSVVFFLFHQEFRVDDTLNINAWSSFKQMSCTTKTKYKVPAYQGMGSGGFKLPSFSLYKNCTFLKPILPLQNIWRHVPIKYKTLTFTI